ncbi:MAG: hypothetical protein JSW73_01025 [Candidatus Woesearchaeota archaeon]|nr:MAG: hypothetical protein JSW73_01025 [Candidatus Woesearchaeota archaeon]
MEEDWKDSTLKALEDLRSGTGSEGPKKKYCIICKKYIPVHANLCPYCGNPVTEKGRKILLEFSLNTEKTE